MKTNGYPPPFKSIFFALICLVYTVTSFAQAPILRFENVSLYSGTDKTIGAVYKFPSVRTGVDALVTLTNISGNISLRNIDRTIDGYSEAFQPEYRISGNSNAYIEFQIRFVSAANNNISVSQTLVDATGLDIDGDGNNGNSGSLKEFNYIDMGNASTYSFNSFNSQLTISTSGTSVQGTNATGLLFGALVDTAASQVMFTVSSANISTMIYRVGANNGGNGSGNRYASLYFKKFNYPGIALSAPKLINFSGSQYDNKTRLDWKFENIDGLNECILEKATGSGAFTMLADYLLSNEIKQNSFSFTDKITPSIKNSYRLKMTGADGSISYSNVLVFASADQQSTVKKLHVYPTLVNDHFTINLTNANAGKGTVQLIDFSGRTVMSQPVVIANGQNTISVSNVKGAAGNYIVRLTTDDNNLYTQRVVLQ